MCLPRFLVFAVKGVAAADALRAGRSVYQARHRRRFVLQCRSSRCVPCNICFLSLLRSVCVFVGVKVARLGNIIACQYNKPEALEYFLRETNHVRRLACCLIFVPGHVWLAHDSGMTVAGCAVCVVKIARSWL
jgi:hypothetical protein